MNRVRGVVSLSLVAGALGCSLPTEPNPAFQSQVLRCEVTRKECIAEGLSPSGGVTCAQFSDPVTFTATACADKGTKPLDVCNTFFCDQPKGIAYGYPNPCSIVATDVTNQTGPDGLCRSVGGGPRLARANVTRRWRDCVPAEGGASCETLKLNGNTDFLCVDTSTTPAFEALQPTLGARDTSILISSFVLNSPNCPLIGDIKRGNLTYDMAASSMGTASAGGASTTLGVRSGFAVSRTDCSSETCVPSIDNLNLNLADRVIKGLPITGVSVTNISPIPLLGTPEIDSGLVTIPPDNVSLLVTGRVNGIVASLVLNNKTPWRAKATSGQIVLQGSLDVDVTDANGHPLRVKVAIDATGKPASSKVLACSQLSSHARLFGFEDVESWRTAKAKVSLVTSPTTQGCGALGLDGSGYIPISSTSFTTSGLSPRAALSIDLFIPCHQPNPHYLGALQMYLSCPSGDVNNQFIGQVELTGKPVNKFSTLRFPLPKATLTTLGRPLNDCSIGLALNVSATGEKWILDNLRFTP